MITILKLTLANIKQKKFRSILIILSILLSVSLMYSVLSLSNSTSDIFEQKIKKEIGNVELMILPKENSGDQYISELNFNNLEGMEYQIPQITAYGYSEIKDEMVPIIFNGTSDANYDTVYGLNFIEKNNEILSKNQVYIGKETAEVYELVLGSKLEVTMAGKPMSFTITGIVEDQNNNLGYDLGRLELIASSDTISEILELEGKVNSYLIKSTSKYGISKLMSNLEAAFPEYDIKDVTDTSDFVQMITMVVTSLLLMVSAVVMVSAFIIYSSFKIISIERMPLMGTLRSIGATKKMTVRTLMYEAGIYGITGGLLGNALGILILQGTMNMMFQNFGMTVEDISYFNIKYIIIASFIGLALALGSALIPIIKMSKKSIRSIIFSEIRNEKHVSIYKTFGGLLLVIFAFIIFRIAPLEYQLALDMIAMLFVTIGAALIIPMLSRILSKLLILLLKPILKDGLHVITENIKNDRTMMNNIMLLAMGLGIILMINNFSTTVGSVVTDVYATGKADALVFSDMDDSFIQKVNKVQGVEHVYTAKEAVNMKANDGKITLMFLEGIDGPGFNQYAWDEFGKYMTDELLEKFMSNRSIILSKFTARKYDLNKGDTLEIDFNGKIINYEVIGVVPTVMNNGNMNFIYEKYLEEDAGIENYQSMYININDNADMKKVLQEIKELLPTGILPIQTLKEMQDQNVKANDMIFFLMKAVSIIAMIIGIFGIFNNFTISFLSRKKLIATMRSLGLSKAMTARNMLFEAFYCGLLGTISGLVLGTVLLKAMCYVLDAMGISGDLLYYSLKDYLFVLVSGIVLAIISSIIPAISISRDNIVNGLRYE